MTVSFKLTICRGYTLLCVSAAITLVIDILAGAYNEVDHQKIEAIRNLKASMNHKTRHSHMRGQVVLLLEQLTELVDRRIWNEAQKEALLQHLQEILNWYAR